MAGALSDVTAEVLRLLWLPARFVLVPRAMDAPPGLVAIRSS